MTTVKLPDGRALESRCSPAACPPVIGPFRTLYGKIRKCSPTTRATCDGELQLGDYLHRRRAASGCTAATDRAARAATATSLHPVDLSHVPSQEPESTRAGPGGNFHFSRFLSMEFTYRALQELLDLVMARVGFRSWGRRSTQFMMAGSGTAVRILELSRRSTST